MRYLSLLLVLLLFSPAKSRAQGGWVQTSGPQGGNVRTVAASKDGQTVLAGLWNGNLYRYTPETQWSPLTPIAGLQSLFASGNILFAHSYDGLFQSYDFGSTWIPVVKGGITTQFSPIVRGKDGLYFLANDSVYRSMDAGETWSLLGPTGKGVHTIGCSEGNRIIVGGFTGVFSSTDRGATWERTEDELPSSPMISSMATVWDREDDEYTVWVSIMNQGVYEYDSKKNEWDKECDGLPEYGNGYPNFSKLFEADGKLYGVTEEQTYQFDFKEETWVEVPHLAGRNIQAYGGKIYSGGPDGVELLSQENNQPVWNRIGSNFLYTAVSDLALARKAVLAASNNGIFRTLDQGITWEKTGNFFSQDVTAGHGVAYAESLDGVMRSTDDGASWALASSGITEELYHLSAVSANSTAVFAGFYDVFGLHGNSHWNSGGIFRSTNSGQTWESVNSGLANDGFAYVPITKLEAYDDAQFALTLSGLYRSTNNGDTWVKQQLAMDPSQDMLTQLSRTPNGTLYLVSLRSLFRSTDAGVTWTPFNTGLQTELENHGTPLVMDNEIYLKSTNMMGEPRMYVLWNGRWERGMIESPSAVDFTVFFPVGTTLYAGTTGSAVWTKPISSSSVKRDVSADLRMDAYPNPFSATATVSFTLRRSSFVQAGLYDVTGRQVLHLVNSMLNEGSNTLTIDATGLPAGSYVCRITTEEGVAQEQVVLLP